MQLSVKMGFREQLRQFVIRLLVRMGRVPEFPVPLERLQAQLNHTLPLLLPVVTPAGEGELRILQGEIATCVADNSLGVELLCDFNAQMQDTLNYNAHLKLNLTASIGYQKAQQRIQISRLQLEGIQLISDKLSLLQSQHIKTKRVITKSIKTLLGPIVETPREILERTIGADPLKYLGLYSKKHKQRAIDFFTAEIDRRLEQMAEAGDLWHPLDKSKFDEKLFADYGKRIRVGENEIIFMFQDFDDF